MGYYHVILDTMVRIDFDGGWLQPLKISDIHPGYIDGLNDPEVNKYLVGVRQIHQTKESIQVFVSDNLAATDSILFGIWRTGFEQHCGTIRIHGIEHFHKTAHIGICLFDKSAWGDKLGLKSINAVSQWVINNLKLRWLEAGIYSENIASEKAFVSAGYEWIYDIPDKYLFEGCPARAKIFAFRNPDIE